MSDLKPETQAQLKEMWANVQLHDDAELELIAAASAVAYASSLDSDEERSNKDKRLRRAIQELKQARKRRIAPPE